MTGPVVHERVLDMLRCPENHASVVWRNDVLETVDGKRIYRLSPSGIPLFADEGLSADAERQKEHYNADFARLYAENLGYPHTQEYSAYLDRVFLKQVSEDDLKEVAEICCGQGELLQIERRPIEVGIGVDISCPMLEVAQKKHADSPDFIFIQGDATKLPLGDAQFSSVFMLGGIHHISDRSKLFSELHRILKPGGKFFFREPVSDFFLWRWIRAAIYRLSPALDAETERPLLWDETVPLLEATGFRLLSWKTYGFLGFCFFMNSDVLVFNRFFRFLPGIRAITRLVAHIDDLTGRLPGFSRAGLQVVGVAQKPER